MSLKSALKQIRERIDEGDNEGAFKIIQEQLSTGIQDYTLFLFAGLASKKLNNLTDAHNYYMRATALDKDNVRAWQGIFELLCDPNWTEPINAIALDVVERLIGAGAAGADTDKCRRYKKERLRFLLSLDKWDLISRELDDGMLTLPDAFTSIATCLTTKKDESAKQLTVKLLSSITTTTITEDENLHSMLCLLHMRVSDSSIWAHWIREHVCLFPHTIEDAQLVEGAFHLLALDLLSAIDADELPNEIAQYALTCSKIQPAIMVARLASLIGEDKLNDAFSLLSTESDERRQWPLMGLRLYIYWRLGQFHKIMELELEECSNEAVQRVKLEATFRLCEQPSEYKELKERINLVVNGSTDQLMMKRLHLLCSIQCGDCTTLEQIQAIMPSQHIADYAMALLYFRSGELDKAREAVRKALLSATSNAAQVAVTHLSARILIARNQRPIANSQLLGAVQKAPYDFETFMLLADNLLGMHTQLDKARSCAERARLLNPMSEQVTALLDRIYAQCEVSTKERLSAIRTFLRTRRSNSSSTWALRQAAILEMNEGGSEVDEAVQHIQKLIRLGLTKDDGVKDASLWTLLSEAYKQKGNLQSAVRASKEALEIALGNYTAQIQLIQLHQGMGQYVEALSIGSTLLLNHALLPAPLLPFVQLLHLHSLTLSLTTSTYYFQQKKGTIGEIFRLANQMIAASNSVLFHKCIALALKELLQFNEPTLMECINEQLTAGNVNWPIKSRLDALHHQIRALTVILKAAAGKSGDAWNDLASALKSLYNLTGDKSHLERAMTYRRQAILSCKNKLKRSTFYCQLGKDYVAMGSVSHAQHCFLRAVHLNRHSSDGWCLLALLYLSLDNRLDEALHAMNEAQKICPNLMEAWMAHALHAERSAHTDTLDLFRHAIVLGPTDICVQKYCYHLVQNIRRRSVEEEEALMDDFDAIKELYYTVERTPDFLHSLALLAEQFWYLDEAHQYIEEIGSGNGIELKRNRERIRIKTSTSSTQAASETQLATLYAESLPKLMDRLSACPPFDSLIKALQGKATPAEFSTHYKPTHFVLLAAAALTFNLSFDQSMIGVIESVRPRHKLTEYYPPGIRRPDEELFLKQQSEDDRVLVRHDHLSEPLYKLLMVVEGKANDLN